MSNNRPNAERLDQLIQWVQASTTRVTPENFDDYLPDIAYEHDPNAACPNGRDHACNVGLGMWLGIDTHGQFHRNWDEQRGYSAARLNVYVDPKWRAAVLLAPLCVQKRAFVQLLTDLRDKGEYIYRLPLLGAPDFADLEMAG